jgi:MFS family permease
MQPQSSRRPLLALFFADAVSMTGNVMAMTAIPWFVLQTTGSAAKTGLTGFFGFLPIVLANLFGGTLVDRLGHKKASVVADLASGATVVLIPLLHLTGGLTFPVLLALVFLGALLDAPGATARSALLPEAAQLAGWTLERASGTTAAVERGSRLAGAPLAGLLIAIFGATNVLWIDAATFFVSALAVVMAVPRIAPFRRDGDTTYMSELKEGLRFVRNQPLVAAIITTVAITNFYDSATTVLLPVYANEIFGSSVSLGLMLGAFGGGAVVGALVFASLGRRYSRLKVFAACFMVVTVWYPVLASFPPQPVAILMMTVAGFASGPLNPIINTVFMERIPAHLRGRVLGVGMAAAWATMPLGVLLTGLVIEWFGLRTTLLALGTAYLVTTFSIWFNPAMKDLDQPAPSAVNQPPDSDCTCCSRLN